MNKEELTERILSSIRGEVQDFIKDQGDMESSVEYEERVLELSRKFAESVISQSMGELPKSRNSKKSFDECRSDGIG